MTLAKAVGKVGAAYLNDKHGEDKVKIADDAWSKLSDDQIEAQLADMFGDATVGDETAVDSDGLTDEEFCAALDGLMNGPTE